MLDLRIPIALNTVKIVKTYLHSTLPDVKSSHRIEAAARGLGFNTYAALRHRAVSGGFAGVVDGATFARYLHERGWNVEPKPLYQAAARVAVTSVLDKTPRLSMWGCGFGRPRWNSDRNDWETPREAYSKFVRDRDELLSEHGLDEFLLALALVRKILPTKTVRPDAGSYRLKHIAENLPFLCPDGTELGPRYVSNGALIAAALYAGFRMKTYIDDLGYDVINVTFNMSKRSVDDLDCEMRPTGAMAQSRAWLAARRQSGSFLGL